MAAETPYPNVNQNDPRVIDVPGVGFVYPKDVERKVGKLSGVLYSSIPSSTTLIDCGSSRGCHDVINLINSDLTQTTGVYPIKFLPDKELSLSSSSNSESPIDTGRHQRHVSHLRTVFP